MENICINCNKTYKAKNSKSKYCSEKCRSYYKYHNFKNHAHECKNCKKYFYNFRKDVFFCSKKCATKFRQEKEISINEITNEILNNEQFSVDDICNKFNISTKRLYTILKENGYDSYIEFIGVIKGVYLGNNLRYNSLSATKCFNLISQILNEEYETEVTFNWLKNDVTGKNLRIDCYFRKSNIGVEYNGAQHYQYIPFLHSEENSFKNQQYRDFLKNKYCKEHGLKLITISYKDKLTLENLKSILSRDN